MPAAITSVGAITGHGLGAEVFVRALMAGRTALREIARFPTGGLCSRIGAEVPENLDLGELRQGRATALLRVAAEEALMGRDLRPSERRGAIVGTTKGALELALSGELEDPLTPLAAALAERCGARGPVITLGVACASSTAALGEALRLIERGDCDEVVVAGVEALHPFVFAGFHALKALSPAPATPFGDRRAGLSLGEGCGVLVLESEARAHARKARAVAWLCGYGSACDAVDQTAPASDGSGLRRACARALDDARVAPERVGRYHAHGTATAQNDAMEAAACTALFGDAGVPVTGAKGCIGHTLGAAGALDAIACALTLGVGVPPVTNTTSLDPRLSVDVVLGGPRADRTGTALLATAGFGGLNAALVLRTSPCR